QTRGIEQVNQAITQMDQVTQQNAALVEEASAAAQSMREQTGALVQAVSVFKVAGGGAVQRAEPVATALDVSGTPPRLAARHPAAGKLAAPARRAGEPAAKRVESMMAEAGKEDWAAF
ncbi:MAG: methyl-accepting chemotaxis protein, partial [Ramlibacter sp.]